MMIIFDNKMKRFVIGILISFVFLFSVLAETPESVETEDDYGEPITLHLGDDYDISLEELDNNPMELPVGTRIVVASYDDYVSFFVDSYDYALDYDYVQDDDETVDYNIAYYYSFQDDPEGSDLFQGCIITLEASYNSNKRQPSHDANTIDDYTGIIRTVGSWIATANLENGELEIYPKERPSNVLYDATASTNLENVTVSLNQETNIPANATIYLTINPNGQNLDYNTLLHWSKIEKISGPTRKDGKDIFTFKKASEDSDQVTISLNSIPAHTHSFSYSVSGATLTATCSDEDCDFHSTPAILTVTSTQTVSTALAAFNTATGLSATAGDVLYNGNNTIPTTPGLYTQTVEITAEEGKNYTLTFPRKLLVLSEDADNSTALTVAAGATSVDVRILRTFKAGYNTLCLPFALTESEISSALSGATISKPSASSGRKAGNITKMTTEVATAISSGGVYIVHFASTPANWAIANTLFENKVITASVTPVTLTGTNTTVKTTYSVLSDSNKLTPGNKKQLFIKDGGNGFTYPKTADDTKLKGFRAWFERE
ncbi:hypothetical protein [Treponema sp.]|uniref:hypothetical protein n=1 Tax=Treponema sp. TaxID=166 RepID=UPI00388EDDC8